MKSLADLSYDELTIRAAEAACLPALDGDEDSAGVHVLDDETRSGYGDIAVTSDAWLRERANAFLRGLPDAPRALDALRRLDEDALEFVLEVALYEIDLEQGHLRAFDPSKHKRWPKGHPKAGKFRPMIDLLKEAITKFDPKKDKHPFELFTRPQLLKAAKDRGIKLTKGEDKDSIAAKLLADLNPDKSAAMPDGHEGEPISPPTPAAKVPKKTAKVTLDKPASQKQAIDPAIQAGDFSGLKRVGPQAGTNTGGVFEAADGSRWYVKAQKSEAHARNEATAAALYREAGIDVPEVHRGGGLAELGDGPQTATRIVDSKSDLSAKLSDPEYVAAVRRGFAVDAWLGNWDVVGAAMDNIVTVDGKPLRVDVGGALLFRAQGKPKGAAFGKSVVEWETLRDPSKAPQASQVFAGITPEQLQESAKLVEKIKPARIKQIVDDPDLAELLIARRADLLARAKKAAAPAKRATTDISAVPTDVRKAIFDGYKAQPKGQLLSSPAADSFDNLVAVAHVYGSKVPGGISPKLAAQIVDEQLAKNLGVANHNLLEKKFADWLATADGKAYALANTTPKKALVDNLTGKVSLPTGVKLKPGEKVQKLSGPGKFDAKQTDFKGHSASEMQQQQDAYMAANGIVWSAAQTKAAQSYTGGGYVDMNGYLRGKHGTSASVTKQHVVEFQSMMMPLQENAKLLRGTGWDQLPAGFQNPNDVKKLIGKTIQEPAFMSTSVAGAGGYFSNKPVKLIIEAPAGTKGVFVKKISFHPSENEFVLAAGQKLHVVDVIPSSGSSSKVTIKLRVVTPK